MNTQKTVKARRTIATVASTVPSPADILESDGGEVSVTLVTHKPMSGEEVTVVVPKEFKLTRDDGAVVSYLAGTQEMPVEDAQHWFTRAQGVKVYSKE